MRSNNGLLKLPILDNDVEKNMKPPRQYAEILLSTMILMSRNFSTLPLNSTVAH